MPPAAAGEGAAAPVDAWLADSSWDCDGVTSFGASRYEIAHSWQFTDTLFTTDLGERVVAEANSGTLPYAGAYPFMGWVSPVDANTWTIGFLATDRHWFGVTDRAALLEVSSSTNDGNPTAFYFDRFDGSDGVGHMAISAATGTTPFIIDCVAAR